MTTRFPYSPKPCNNQTMLANDPANYTIEINKIQISRSHLNEELGISFFTLGKDEEKLVFVNKIEKNSPAHMDGRIYEGDLVLKINGIMVDTIFTAFRTVSDPDVTRYEIEIARPVLKISQRVYGLERDRPTLYPNFRHSSSLSVDSDLESFKNSPYSNRSKDAWDDSREKDSGLDFMNSYSDESYSSEHSVKCQNLLNSQDRPRDLANGMRALKLVSCSNKVMTHQYKTYPPTNNNLTSDVGKVEPVVSLPNIDTTPDDEELEVQAYEIIPLPTFASKNHTSTNLPATTTTLGHLEGKRCFVTSPKKIFVSNNTPCRDLSVVMEENIYEDPLEIVHPFAVINNQCRSIRDDTTSPDFIDVQHANHLIRHMTPNDSFGEKIRLPCHRNTSEPGDDVSPETVRQSQIMYTNKENLFHTIMLQQKLFEQARKAVKVDKNKKPLTDEGSQTAITVSRVQRMKFKIKRRSDGTKYILRINNDLGDACDSPSSKNTKLPKNFQTFNPQTSHLRQCQNPMGNNKKHILTVLTV